MANEDKKDFNKMLNNNKDMPKIVKLDSEASKKWGGKIMIIAPPIYYDEVIKKIPYGKLITLNEIRKFIAKNNNADITCPLTAGIFVNICAWASYQRNSDVTPCFRVLKSDGELNLKYPNGVEKQIKLLESEGHEIISKGNKNVRYYVKDYQESLYNL